MHLPEGFQYADVVGGIKASGKPDVAIIQSTRPCVAAAVTTTNQIVAAPVLLCRETSPRATCRAIIVNSGNANACTGEQGMRDAVSMRKQVAERLSCDPEDVLVMSTGVIGQPLPMDAVTKGIDLACEGVGNTQQHFESAADGICTTDQFRKVATTTIDIDSKTYRIAAMCKGAGMIAPNMATMLGAIVTDAPLDAGDAQDALQKIVDSSFNRVSVDGHTSTNDTVVLMSSGSAGESCLTAAQLSTFIAAASQLSLQLAKMLVRDGEGAARFFEVKVNGAKSDQDAETIARCVAASPLVKTAITGGDPNWGRVVSAAGYAGVAITPEKTSLSICGVSVFSEGTPIEIDASALSKTMKSSVEVMLDLTVGEGSGRSSFWASDLTEAYVRFNSLYTT